ncbi:oligosaccharide flippase family protein [Flavobacteriaceae bacterium]|nr:oligosaccharide flippase family protein [Flavobacteriaceae bacterium]
MLNIDKNSSIYKVIKNAGILLSGDIPANIFKLLSLAIFSHTLGAEILGYYVLFLSTIEVIDRVFNFQTWQAFIKFASTFQAKKEHNNILMLLKYTFIIDFITLLLATLVTLLISRFVVEFFNIPIDFLHLLYLLSITILLKIADISTGIFRFFNRFGIQSKIAIYTSIFRLFLFGLAALIAPSFGSFIYAIIFTSLISLILKYAYSKSVLLESGIKISEILKVKIDTRKLKKLKVLSFVIYNNFDVALRLISTQLDVFLLGKLYSSEIVGIYKITKEISKVTLKLNSPIYQSIYPEFAKLLANKKFDLVKKMTLKISLYAGTVGLIFYLIFYLIGEGLIVLAFGEEMAEAYSTSLIYIIAVIINMISLPFPSLMHSMGLAKQAFYNQFIASIIYIAILLVLAAKFSIYGAAVSMIFFNITWLVGSSLIIYRYKPS